MKLLGASILLALLVIPSNSYSFNITDFPELIGLDPVLTRSVEIQTWDPENMFEHVNGEAELLKRYGAVSLTFVSYENDTGDYVSVDLLDLGEPINAYGLYRLYSGCDGEELNVHDATILADDYTPYVFWGRYFLRINIDTNDNTNNGSVLVADFLKHFTEHLPEQSSLPPTLEFLRLNARKSCEVNYHPEHIDYDLETGPGYSWIGKDGNSYAVIILDSHDNAELHAKTLKDKGVSNVLLWKNAVIWAKDEDGGSSDYVQEIIKQIIKS